MTDWLMEIRCDGGANCKPEKTQQECNKQNKDKQKEKKKTISGCHKANVSLWSLMVFSPAALWYFILARMSPSLQLYHTSWSLWAFLWQISPCWVSEDAGLCLVSSCRSSRLLFCSFEDLSVLPSPVSSVTLTPPASSTAPHARCGFTANRRWGYKTWESRQTLIKTDPS